MDVGEPIFIPNGQTDGCRGEDDGVILSVVLDSLAETSYLLLLDARDMREICRAKLASAIPFGFHGNFLDDSRPEYLD